MESLISDNPMWIAIFMVVTLVSYFLLKFYQKSDSKENKIENREKEKSDNEVKMTIDNRDTTDVHVAEIDAIDKMAEEIREKENKS